MNESTATPAADEDFALVLFVSLPYFHHEVFKCHGTAREGAHEAFYAEYLRKKHKGSTVIVVSEGVADRITFNPERAEKPLREAVEGGWAKSCGIHTAPESIVVRRYDPIYPEAA